MISVLPATVISETFVFAELLTKSPPTFAFPIVVVPVVVISALFIILEFKISAVVESVLILCNVEFETTSLSEVFSNGEFITISDKFV